MEFEVPQVIGNIKEITAIYGMNDKVDLLALTEGLEGDLLTLTATLRGIKRREKEYGITPKDTDSMEDRRYRVLLAEMRTLPFTEKSLRKKLDAICGSGNYELTISADKVVLKVELTRKSMFEDLQRLINEVTPLNMLVECTLRYNQHSTLAKFIHAQLAKFTHTQLRNEVLK